MRADFLKKIPIAIAALVATSAFAAMDMDSRVSQLEQHSKQVRTETPNRTHGATTAPASPQLMGTGWYVGLDVLYWTSKVGGTEFTYSAGGVPGALPLDGEVHDIDFDWDWGFRVGLGYIFEHDAWDLNLMYTHFYNNGSRNRDAMFNQTVIPLLGSTAINSDDPAVGNTFRYAESAKSTYNMDYDGLILNLGRDYFVSRCLSMRPNWGLHSAWFDLKQITRYADGDPQTGGLGLNTATEVNQHQKIWGLGPQVGWQSDWHLGNGFSLFSNIRGSLVYSHFKVRFKQEIVGSVDKKINEKVNRHSFVPNVQYQVGVAYGVFLNDAKQHLQVSAGFEGQYWWNLNQIAHITNSFLPPRFDRHDDNVSFHGLTLSARVCF